MTPEGAIISLLKGNTAINTALGGRIMYAYLGQDIQYPAAFLYRVHTTRLAQQGKANTIREAEIILALVGKDAPALKETASDIQDLLHGYRGAAGSATLQKVEVNDERDLFEAEFLFQIELDITVTYSG